MKEFKHKLTEPLNNQQQVVELYRAAIATRSLSPRDSDKIAIATLMLPTHQNLTFNHQTS